MERFSLDDIRDTFRADIESFLQLGGTQLHTILAGQAEHSALASSGYRALLRHCSAALDAIVRFGDPNATECVRVLTRLVERAMVCAANCADGLRHERDLAAFCTQGIQAAEAALAQELAKATAAAAEAARDFLELDVPTPSPLDVDATAEDAGDGEARGSTEEVLANLHAALSDRLAATTPLLMPIVDTSASQPAFAVVAHCAHAMHGSAALVGADSLAAVSTKLENVSQAAVSVGRQCARQLELTYTSLMLGQHIVGVLQENLPKGYSRKFRQPDLLRDVLQNARPIAEGLDPFLADADDGAPEELGHASVAAPTLTFQPTSDDEEFSFEAEAEAAPSGDPAEPVIDAELRAVFLEEANGCLNELVANLQRLASGTDTAATLAALHRVYHQLKGAAATIGLQALGNQALDLEDSVEVLQPVPESVTADHARDLTRRTEALYQGVGIDLHIDLGCPAPTATVPTFDDQARAELDRIFREEAIGLCVDLKTIADSLATAVPTEPAPAVAATLERTYHKLKGSAVVSSARQVAKEAERMQRICSQEVEAGALATAVRASLGTLQGLLAFDDAALVAAPSPSVVELEPSPASEWRRAPTTPTRTAVTTESEPALWSAFEIEAQELLDDLERNIVALEQSRQPRAVFENLFRSFHTLKGAVNTVGLGPIGDFVHQIESFLERCLGPGILPPPHDVGRMLTTCVDRIRGNLRQAREGFVETDVAWLANAIQALEAPGTRSLGSTIHTEPPSVSGRQSGEESRASGSATDSTTPSTNSEDRIIRVGVRRLDALMNLAGELVVSRARMTRRVNTMRTLLNQLNACRQRLNERVEDFAERHQFQTLHGRSRAIPRPVGAQEAPPVATTTTPRAADAVESQFSELELDRYDDINILARSLQEINSDISEIQREVHGALDQFASESDTFSAIIAGLQAEITQARMVPIDQLFLRLRRPVRDCADRERKEVRVVTVGDTVNLDKNIIDELYAPMLHLVRNCVSHGLETREQRSRAGKDPVGTVTLSARQESGQIILEVSDDGAGIDRERLRRKGIERGLISPEVAVDDPAVLELVFATGLSTRDIAGSVAGRGVGCDVAKRVVERLNGHIRVSTTTGRGTSFVITLPLTLAIYRALMIQQGDQVLAVPLNFAERILDLADHDVVHSNGASRILIESNYHRLHHLSRELGQDIGEASAAAVVLRLGDQRAVVSATRVLGQEEIVVKSIGDLLAGHPLFSGVTITGDGRLILIVDVPGLFERLGEKVQTISTDRVTANHPELTVATQTDAVEERPVRVLYVDDSLSVRKAAEKYLRALGAEITLAVDGIDALDKVRKGSFDIVFTDLEMPRMHGYELIRELRYIPAYKDLPLVVVTSRSGDKHRQQAEQLGATGYVTKPFSQETLASMISRWTDARNQAGVMMVGGGTPATR